MVERYDYYTDGACSVLSRKGGYAFARLLNEEKIDFSFSKGESDTTNNRMELKAIIASLLDINKLVESSSDKVFNFTIKSDSQYCINAINKWLSGWVKNDFFRDNSKRAVKNIDLWEKFVDINDSVSKNTNVESIKFEWVKGHSSNIYNDIVDKLAVKAKESIQ